MDEISAQSDTRPETSAARRKTGAGSFATSSWFWVGVFLMVFCGGLIVTYVAEIITGQTKHGVSSQLGLITFLSGLFFVGWKLVETRLNESKAWRELKEEQLILNRAKANGGSLTVSETALACRISIADSKKAFERLSMSGVCQVDVTEEGELCYNFPSLRLKIETRENQMLHDTDLIQHQSSESRNTS